MKTLIVMCLAFALTAVCTAVLLSEEANPEQAEREAKVAPQLQKLQNPLPEVRAQGARELGVMGPEAAPAVAELVRVLKEDQAVVRREAALALGRIGKDANEGLAALGRAIQDRDKLVRVNAIRASGRINKANVLATIGDKKG